MPYIVYSTVRVYEMYNNVNLDHAILLFHFFLHKNNNIQGSNIFFQFFLSEQTKSTS